MTKFEKDLKNLLLDVSHVLDNAGLNYFLIQGTALGAYRNKKFVPNEKDVDLGFLQEHLDSRYLENTIIEGFMDYGCDVFLISRPFAFLRTIMVRRGDAKLDLVGFSKTYLQKPVTEVTPEGVMREISGYVRFACSPDEPKNVLKPYAIVHEATILEKYDDIMLFNKTFKIPLEIEKYLTLEYSNEWRIPKEDHISRTRIYNFFPKYVDCNFSPNRNFTQY